MSLLSRIFSGTGDRRKLLPLYEAVVKEARAPFWYRDGGVPDTVDGRFDMVAAILALVLVRLEGEDSARHASVHLAETFVEDMDGSLRQIGIGDLMVGKHVGSMMGALGGRIAALRQAVADGAGFDAAVARNIFHDPTAAAPGVALVADRLEALHAGLAATPVKEILAGRLP